MHDYSVNVLQNKEFINGVEVTEQTPCPECGGDLEYRSDHEDGWFGCLACDWMTPGIRFRVHTDAVAADRQAARGTAGTEAGSDE